MATSFFNDGNSRVGGDLVELLEEAQQEIPEFLERYKGDGTRKNPSADGLDNIMQGKRSHQLPGEGTEGKMEPAELPTPAPAPNDSWESMTTPTANPTDDWGVSSTVSDVAW